MKNTEYIKIKTLVLKKIKAVLSAEEEKELSEIMTKNKPLKDFIEKIGKKAYIADQYKLYKQFSAEEDWSIIARSLLKSKRRSVGLRLMRWAAILLIPITLAGVYYLTEYKPANEELNAEQFVEFVPGKSEAILVLSSGEHIILDHTNDTTLQDAGTGIAISKEHGIAYTGADVKQLDQKPLESIMNILKVERGREYSLTLADGTKVWVNSESELKFPVNFTANKRDVYLKGEAYFEVAKNTEQAFMVNGETMNVEVTGTSFNVMNYENEKEARVTLIEGQVLVGNTKGLEVKLSPDQQAIIDVDSIRIKEVNAALVAEWRNNSFGFEYENLTTVVNKLSRWYNVEFIFEDEEIKSNHFSGKLPKYENIAGGLELLALTTNIRFTKEGDKIMIEKEK